ncbi:Rhodanese-like domain-containing protein [Xylariales sp. PMI_506]|nr:Rhodanese-like domain-containing protein [Xylariales sp. PMI_506]
MASSITLGDLNRITAPKLADLLLASGSTQSSPGGSSIAIVDVRDDGGHIRDSLHFPSRSLDATMPTLIRKLEDKDTVVFHCALSQQRGPSAALRYLREREAQSRARAKGAAAAAAAAAGGDAQEKKQVVYVLDRGFVGWQETYGTDERLTDGYRKDLWEDGYWG